METLDRGHERQSRSVRLQRNTFFEGLASFRPKQRVVGWQEGLGGGCTGEINSDFRGLSNSWECKYCTKNIKRKGLGCTSAEIGLETEDLVVRESATLSVLGKVL